jgi:Protein of unknown function (DUF1553)/Protein of unknown function (DUF1549)/Planctomycete cytochrome C
MTCWMGRMAACALVAALGTAGAASAGSPPRPVGYNRDIRPLLADNCFACHGPDKNNRKAKLRLDDRAVALARGAIVPGQPEKSELVSRIFSEDPEERMPPPRSHKTLKKEEKVLLQRWIAEGAVYEPYWAYVAPRRPPVPQMQDRRHVRTPIDAFVLEKLGRRKIAPSPEADRPTLLRRLSLDLIGLPPTPAEVDAFVRDTDPRAYEKQVERLLASRHYGERMAVPWLDVVRYADTVGFHGDQNQRIFPYRDYVIDAFNANKPFDQFTIEQLAGDLLPHPTTEQRIATGFNRLNMMTREGGAQPKEYLARYAADRVRTLGAAWLGATLGCCECHDHKFDPFTTKDFYQLEAFFADIKQWGVYQDYGYTPNPDLPGWSNDHPFPPEIEVSSPALVKRMEGIRRSMRDLFAKAAMPRTASERAAWARWQEQMRAVLSRHEDGWIPLAPLSGEKADADGKTLLAAKRKGNPPFTATLPEGWLASLQVELFPHQQMGGSIFRGKKATLQITAKLTRQGGKTIPLTYRQAEADLKEPTYRNGEELLGIPAKGWKLHSKKLNQPHRAYWLLTTPVATAVGDVLTVQIAGPQVDYLRVRYSPLAGESPFDETWEEAARVLRSSEHTNDADNVTRAGAYLLGTAWNQAAYKDYLALYDRWRECRGGKAWTLVTEAVAKPLTVRVLRRGNWQDETGDIVSPQVPHFLPQPAEAGKRRLSRLDLARWLVSPDNPLTARAVMNRLWKELFGQGISARLDDLGGMGEWPTHPELLDWLAVEFRESGWDVKHMVRLMVLSNTYRQSSNLRTELREMDPQNRLLAAQNPRRLEAEFVRDNVLTIAGLLNREYGGPSAWPYQPAHYYENLQFPDRDYLADRDGRQYRRGVYMHWQRTFLHPMLANFDAPTREDCIASRNIANTPQQALTLLNDPTFVEAARVFAGKLLAAPHHSDGERLDAAFRQGLARSAKPAEAASLRELLSRQRSYYRAQPTEASRLLAVGIAPNPPGLDPAEHAAWTSVCRTILNLHETITRY